MLGLETSAFKWQPNPGPQAAALGRRERELLYGGARGGGKTEMGIIAMAMPAVARTEFNQARHPYYRGLVLRRHADDLKDWVDRAEQIYQFFGAVKVGNPPMFRFPEGQRIYTGHLRDIAAVYKYLGQQYHRILLEEATLIPNEELYKRILGSLRSIHPDLPPQMILTANPGGPGHVWVRNRFVVSFDADGKPVVAGVPFRGDDGNWRIYIPARVEDNPVLFERDPEYVASLDALPDALRRAWRLGDWNSFAGQYFQEFRPDGPMGEEEQKLYPWANHVVDSLTTPLEPWWYRWGSGDWGYDHPSAWHWYCEDDIGRVHVYRELFVRKLSALELGVKLAEASAPDMDGLPDHHLVFALDPKAWSMTDEGKTIAERIAQGVDTALGKGVACLLGFSGQPVDPERMLPEQGKPSIVLRPAENERVTGWMSIREMLRWKPLFAGTKEEVLPRLQIHGNKCPHLVDTLSSLIFDEKKPEDVLKMNAINGAGGDDAADSLRYGMMAYQNRQNLMPLGAWLAAKMNEIAKQHGGELDPTTAYMVAEFQEQKYRERFRGISPVTFKRLSSRRGR